MSLRFMTTMGLLGALGFAGCSLNEGKDDEPDGDGWNDGAQSDGNGGPEPPVGDSEKLDSHDDLRADAAGAELCTFDATPRTLIAVAPDARSYGAAVYAREMLNSLPGEAFGLPPAPTAVQAFDMINAYGLGYGVEDSGVLEAGPAYDASGNPSTAEVFVQVALVAPEMPRRKVHAVLVADTSGSMSGAAMKRQKSVLTTIANTLTLGDVVSVVSWNSEARELLRDHPVAGPADPALLGVIDELTPSGGNQLGAGLTAAYQIALAEPSPDLERRLVVLTDGAAPVDPMATGVFEQLGSEGAELGIGFIGVGVGPIDSYHHKLLSAALDTTRGAFAYVGSDDDEVALAERLDGLLADAYFDVELHLDVPSFISIVPVEEPSPDVGAPLRRQHLAAGGTMVFRRALTACDPAAFSDESTASMTIGGRLVYRETPKGELSTLDLAPIAIHDLVASESPRMLRTRALLGFASALKVPTVAEVEGARALLATAGLPELADLLARHPVLSPASDP